MAWENAVDIIATRHAATALYLQGLFPEAEIKPEVRSEDLRGKVVVGTLPINLVARCAIYGHVYFKVKPPRNCKLNELQRYEPSIAWYTVKRIM